jgi:hypothetical protein
MRSDIVGTGEADTPRETVEAVLAPGGVLPEGGRPTGGASRDDESEGGRDESEVSG